jgi:hypothetical protein
VVNHKQLAAVIGWWDQRARLVGKIVGRQSERWIEMQETEGSANCNVDSVCDVLRFIGDASYAILPKDVAHEFGELQKNVLGGIRWLIDKEIEWVDARVEGGDRLREEWRRGSTRTPDQTTGSGI